MSRVLTPEEVLSDALDRALVAYNTADEERRDLERQARQVQGRCTALDEEARRLRLALFAIEGKPEDLGAANSANSKRRADLKRAPVHLPVSGNQP